VSADVGPAAAVPIDRDVFRLGVNYWPAGHAMEWLSAYDPAITRRDFDRARAAGLDCLRIFVRWADVQPAEAVIDAVTLRHLVDAADAAAEAGAALIVTLFVGHMSGVNWAPAWATGGHDGDRRFRVLTPGPPERPSPSGLRNWYSDPAIGAAQERLATAVSSALAGHAAVWMWDLGNENSNCTVPPDPAAGSAWLERMTAAIRAADPGRPITVGLHMEDLEDDRRIGPAEVARHCEVVSMHGYPPYTSWADGPTDDHLLPFLALLTRWIAGGSDVLFEEFGLATRMSEDDRPGWLVDEESAAAYTGRALDGLRGAGCSGALLWCFSDYERRLHEQPPFDEALHERTFGLWRSDRSAKPAVAELTRRVGLPRTVPPADLTWLDIGVEDFLADRGHHISRLYRRFRREDPSYITEEHHA
jgi:endo-1,4-beta-mannosidase